MIVAMFQSELPRYLPTADELPCSDDTPVDNELQELIPALLNWYTEDNQRYPTPEEQKSKLDKGKSKPVENAIEPKNWQLN
jgi:hypothetical protein